MGFKLNFSKKTGEDLYYEIKGRVNDLDYLIQARSALNGRGKLHDRVLVDLVNSKLEIYELKKRINELEGSEVYNLGLLAR